MNFTSEFRPQRFPCAHYSHPQRIIIVMKPIRLFLLALAPALLLGLAGCAEDDHPRVTSSTTTTETTTYPATQTVITEDR